MCTRNYIAKRKYSLRPFGMLCQKYTKRALMIFTFLFACEEKHSPPDLYHPANLIGIPYGIHDVLGFSRIPDEKEIR